jgi:predicted SprT family Zn-dependent metalloprotease
MQRPTSETYKELQLAVDVFNKELFDGQLPDCLITLQRRPRTSGYFSPARFGTKKGQTTDDIALNPENFALHPLLYILQVIGHEQVHQWQHHFGKPTRRTYHDKEWSDKMISIGLMPSHTGEPGGRKVGQKMADYPMPGGRFLEVANRLLADRSFVITWYDRYPSRRPSASDLEADLAFDEDDDPDDWPGEVMALVHAAGGQTLAASASSASGTSVATRRPRPDWAVPAVMDGLALAEPPPAAEGAESPADRSNRTRYVCPKCSVKVWGKPGLQLACLTCNAQFR